MELKINNQTKQFATDSSTVQALLDLEIPENKTESPWPSTIPSFQNRIGIPISLKKPTTF